MLTCGLPQYNMVKIKELMFNGPFCSCQYTHMWTKIVIGKHIYLLVKFIISWQRWGKYVVLSCPDPANPLWKPPPTAAVPRCSFPLKWTQVLIIVHSSPCVQDRDLNDSPNSTCTCSSSKQNGGPERQTEELLVTNEPGNGCIHWCIDSCTHTHNWPLITIKNSHNWLLIPADVCW